MTYDCFTFFNELDLLEIRLNVLKGVVDRFVICEAPWTHAGDTKPLYFKENESRFAAFKDKIIYLEAREPPAAPADFTFRQRAWLRENWQRNELARGLTQAQATDTILLSDLDEIPAPEAVEKVKGLPGVTRFGMRFYNFFLNFRNYSVYNWPIGTQACSYATFMNAQTYAMWKPDEFVLAEVNEGPTMTKLRMAPNARQFKDAGWHFSFIGNVDAIIKKFQSFAHTEQNTSRLTSREEIIKTLTTGETSSICRGYAFFAEPIDESYPPYIRENQAKYAEFIMPCTEEYLKRTRFRRYRARLKGAAYNLMVRCIPPFLVPFALSVRRFLHTRRVGQAVRS